MRVQALYRSDRVKDALERRLPGRDGIRSVSANVWTGTVLIFFDPQEKLEQVLASAAQVAGSASSKPADPPPRSLVTENLFPSFRSLAGWFGALGRGFDRANAPARVLAPPRISSGCACPWHTLEVSQVAQFWETSLADGLPAIRAQQRLAEYGPNVLASYTGRSALAIFANQFKSLPVLLLLGSATLSVFTGGIGDAVVITLVVALNASLGFATEMQAERTIAALLDFAEPIVPVIRDGAVLQSRGEEVVPGDLIVLNRGTQVVADARIVAAQWLTVDEAALTGESMPVEKSIAPIGDELAPIVQRNNMVFRGTVITGGTGLALVVATAQSTEIGTVQRLIAESGRPETPLERQLGVLGNQLVWATGLVAGSVLAVGLLRGFSFLQMVNSAISLAVAAVPEGLPVVATSALASAVHALLTHNVLVRRLDAIETLGAVQVVALDKTGTLTLNRMAVSWVFTGMTRYLPNGEGILAVENSTIPPTGPEITRFAEICALCNEADVERENGLWIVTGSPTEAALIDMALKSGSDVQAIRKQYPLVKTEGRSEHRNYMTTWHDAGNNRELVAVKGNPAEVLALCGFYAHDGKVTRLTRRRRQIIEAENGRMADSALRVLGAACLETERGADAALRNNGLARNDLTWLGLVGMADPLRADLPELMQTLRKAGIRPIMITGDQAATAQAVARSLELGGESEVRVMDAACLGQLNAEEFRKVVSEEDIFARVTPSDKLRIVQALQKGGRVVAMTGDGINDGPALRAADIGITLGKSGTEVAREIADVVLRDDNIHTLIPAIRDGRRIHENIRRAIHYISATNTSEVLLMLLSLAFGMGQPLTARQLLWINVLTDVFPELALAVQAAESDVMHRPPRDPAAPVMGSADLPRLARQCGFITAAGFGCYAWGVMRYGIGPQASTVAFLGLAATQLLHAFSARSEVHSIFERKALPPNHFLSASVGGSLAALIVSQFALRGLLGTAPIGPLDFLVCGAAAGGSLLLNEMSKGLPSPVPKALPAVQTRTLDAAPTAA